MKVRIGTLELSEDTKQFLRPPLQGVLRADIRTATGNFSGRDGGWVSSQFYSPRQIVINGGFAAGTCEEAEQLLCELQDATPIRQSLPVEIETDTGRIYFTEAYLLDLNADITSKKFFDFQLSLIAPDPFFYQLTGGTGGDGWVEQEIEEVIGGGYVTPYVLPVAWDPSGQPTIITNSTDLIVYPQIILDGNYTNPTIRNLTTGQFIKVNVTTSPTDQIIIDMRERTITLNGSSIIQSRSGNWWGLVPGENQITLETDSGSDIKTGIIRYRLPATGIYDGACDDS